MCAKSSALVYPSRDSGGTAGTRMWRAIAGSGVEPASYPGLTAGAGFWRPLG